MEPRDLGALVRIKFFGRVVDYLLLEKSPLSASFAVVVCDATSESVLRLVLRKLFVKVDLEELVPSLIRKAEGKLGKPELRVADLNHLHAARNKILHELLILDETEARAICGNSIECISAIVKEVFGVGWASISLGELFYDALVRKLYIRAESELQSGRPADAIVSLVACFEQARNNEQLRIYGSGISLAEQAAENAVSGSTSDDAIATVFAYAKAVREETEILKLGVDYKSYRKFADLDPNSIHPRFLEGAPVFQSDVDAFGYWNARVRSRAELRAGDSDWIRFAFRFVEDSVLSWQSVSRQNLVDMILGATLGVMKSIQNLGKK